MTTLKPPHGREWTVDDLADLPADLNYELINGRLILPSATPAHQDLCLQIANVLHAHCPPDYLVSFDQSLKINRRNEPRPDVVAIRVEHYGRTPVPVEDAVLAVEVVSEHSVFRDLVEKAQVYARAGIANYWVVDQKAADISLIEMVLDPEARRYNPGTTTSEVFSVTEPWPITIDLPALTERRNALLERMKPADS